MTDFSRWNEILTGRGLRLLIILLVAFVFLRLVRKSTSRLIQPAKNQTRAAHQREDQTRSAAQLLRNIGAMVIGTLAVLLALPEFGFTVGPAATIAGLAILAVGIGARGMIADLVSGLLVLREDQFSVGDLIRANGETGRVEQFTTRRTLIRNERGALITIPNRLIEQVANLSRDWSQTVVDVTLPSSELIGPAVRLLESVSASFREDSIWSPALVDGPRVLGVESLALEGTHLRVQVKTMLQRQEDVARELRRRIRIAFEEAGILTGGLQRIELLNPSKSNYETEITNQMEEPDGRSHS